MRFIRAGANLEVAEQQVHSNVSDLGLLAETATAARENLPVEENESMIERVADRLAARPEVMDRVVRSHVVVHRRESVEHPSGSIKQWMGQGAFLTRRLANVRGEFSLTALAYYLRGALNLVGIPALTAVVAR